MTKELEQRVERLEAWAYRTFGNTLAEFDTEEQAKERAKQEEHDRKAGEKALAAIRKELEGGE